MHSQERHHKEQVSNTHSSGEGGVSPAQCRQSSRPTVDLKRPTPATPLCDGLRPVCHTLHLTHTEPSDAITRAVSTLRVCYPPTCHQSTAHGTLLHLPAMWSGGTTTHPDASADWPKPPQRPYLLLWVRPTHSLTQSRTGTKPLAEGTTCQC